MILDTPTLLERTSSDPAVVALLGTLGIAQPIKPPKRDQEYRGVEAKAYGIALNFSRAEDLDLPGMQDLPEGTLVVSTVFLFAERVQKHRQYQGALPHGLKFGMSRDQVRTLLGEPHWTSPMLPVDRWHYDGYRLAVNFDDCGVMTYLSVGLPR